MAAPRKTTPVVDQKVAEAYASGAKVADLSDEFGISAGTVRAIVLRTGGTLRPIGRPRQG